MSPFLRQLLRLSLPCLFWLLMANAYSASPTPTPSPTPAAPQATTAPATGAANDELSPWAMTRYEKMIRKSPFAPATVAPTTAPTPGFAANLYVTGMAKMGDRDFVSIASRDQSTRFSLFTGDTNSQDIQLVSVQWSDAIGKSKVTVKKGNEFGVLEYDQALIQKAAAMQPPPPVPGAPQIPGMAQPPRPVVIPRPNAMVQPQPFQPNVNPSGNGQPQIPTRRRSIIRNE